MQKIFDIVMPMPNLLDYSDIYSMTLGSLWNYYIDEINDDENENDDNGNKINNNKTTASKSFRYETMRWERNCIITEISRTLRAVDLNADPVVFEVVTEATGAKFQITNTKFYVPVVTFSINDNIKFLENIKLGFKRAISWNKYRSEITTQTKNNNLDYLIDPTFRNINRLFVISFKNGDNDPTSDSFDKYFMPLVEIKDFNALIDSKPFFYQPVKNKQEAYEKLIEVSRNYDYTTGILLYYLYHQNYYKLIAVDLSRQTNMNIPKQIDFTGKLEEDMVNNVFYCRKAAKNNFEFFFRFINFSLDT